MSAYLLPLGTVLIAAMSLLTRDQPLPPAASVVIAAYLAAVCSISLYRPLGRLLNFFRSQLLFIRAARESNGELHDTVCRLGRALASDYSNTVPYLLSQLSTWPEVRGKVQGLDDPEYLEALRRWREAVGRRLTKFRVSEFSNLCSEVGQLVQLYGSFCEDRRRRLQALIAANELPEERARHLKQQWNTLRDGHVDLVREWSMTVKRINKRTRITLCPDYYDGLGTLE
jgi:hypothetical protein